MTARLRGDRRRRPRPDARVGAVGARAADPEEGGCTSQRMTPLPEAAIADPFRAALAAAAQRAELDRGLTLVGPHRDDRVLRVRGLPVKGYAIHGESWSFALALRLASAELLRAESRLGDPVLILDDVFAELDSGRRRTSGRARRRYEQVLVTAAVVDDVPDALRAQHVRVEAGGSWRAWMPEPTRRGARHAVPDRGDVPETVATYLRLRGLEPSARTFRKRRRRSGRRRRERAVRSGTRPARRRRRARRPHP